MILTAAIGAFALAYPAPPAQGELEAKLIPVGKQAPDFTLKMPDGKSLKFSSVYSKNKVTILNFWFYH